MRRIAFDLDETLGVPLIEGDGIVGFQTRPGCLDLLERLRPRYTLCLWSVSSRRYVEKCLSFGLARWFAETYSWDELPAAWKDVRRIGADLLVDDSPHHREAAATIGRLVNLEDLWLNNNRLAALPDSFRLLASLKKLALDDNCLERFPEAILELKRLEELRLTGNRIPALPEEIGGLTELRSLSLGRNKLTTLPRGIGRLEKLTYLGLQWNPLRSLPDELWRLPCLVTLNLGNTGFTKLPPAAANIPNIIGLPGQRIRS